MDELYEYIIKSRSNICQNIKIKEQINIWKKSNRNKSPQILIDLEHFRDVFAQRDQTGIFLGGRYQIYNNLFIRFVKELISNGVNVQFFSAVHQATDQLDLFLPKMEMEYYRHIKLMDNRFSDLQSHIHHEKSPSVPATIEYNLLALVKKLCAKNSLHHNYYRHSQEIIQYANAHSDDVLAIISNDLQLLLFDGTFQFWYSNGINFKTLNTTAICLKTLEMALVVNTQQAQLLSVLIGSPYLPSFVIDNFLSKCDIHETNKVEILATLITQKTTALNIDLESIASDIDRSFGSKTDIVNAIENGLNCYDTTFSVSTLCGDAFTIFSKERNPFIYTLIVDNVFLVKDIAFVDYRFADGRNFANLIIPLLQKMMGILFKKSLIKPMDRKICIKFAHDEPFRVVQIPIIYPADSLPPIFDLVYKNRENKYDSVRWSLLKWLLNLNSKFFADLRKLPIKYIAVVLTIQHLLQQCIISHLQADTILYCEFEARERNEDEMPPSIPYPQSIEIECVRIAHFYTKIFVLINRCLEVCGLNRQTELIRFDGPHFCKMLEKFTKLQAPEVDAEISEIQALRIYLPCQK